MTDEKGTQVQLVTLALYSLGGATELVDTEDVAMKVNELAPGRFSWRKYPEQINLELVRVFLSEAKSERSGGLVAGSGRTGWSLTTAGRKWVEGPGQHLVDQDLTRSRGEKSSGSVDEVRWQRERLRLLALPAFAAWQTSGQLSNGDAESVFRIDRYVTGRSRDLKVARLVEMFKEDPELARFVATAAQSLKGETDGRDEE